MQITERYYDGPDCYPWRKTFALWPVRTINGQYVWFKTVYKRKYWVTWGAAFMTEPHVEYATFFEVLSHDGQ